LIHLLNLLAAIALLVWSTHLVRTGMLRVAGENLRGVLAKSFSNRLSAMAAGLGVTSLVQSATATCLIVASFVGKNLVATSAALAVMLGADVGSALMAAMCDYADRWAGALRLELTVFVDNEPAIALYRKFGFEVEGTHRAYALRDGAYVDTYAMARLHPNPPALA